MPSEILALGYPEAEGKPTKKKAFSDVVFFNAFG